MSDVPEISVSMHDAANTREDEQPDICDGCDQCPEDCGCIPDDCEVSMSEAAAEAAFEARRDSYD